MAALCGCSWQAEAIFGTLGARRTEALGLQSLQQQLKVEGDFFWVRIIRTDPLKRFL